MKFSLPKAFGSIAALAALVAAISPEDLASAVGASNAPLVVAACTLIAWISHSPFGSGGKRP